MKEYNGFYETSGYGWTVRVVGLWDLQTYQCRIIDTRGMDTVSEGTLGLWFEGDLLPAASLESRLNGGTEK